MSSSNSPPGRSTMVSSSGPNSPPSSSSAPPFTASSSPSTSGLIGNNNPTNEEQLRRQLRAALQSLTRREPLDATYKPLLLSGVVTRRSPVIPKDKFYKRMGSKIRERVQQYMMEMQGKDPFDRISQRQPLEEAAMRAAFTLREAKDHEQQALLEATLAAKELDPLRKRLWDMEFKQLGGTNPFRIVIDRENCGVSAGAAFFRFNSSSLRCRSSSSRRRLASSRFRA